MNLASAFILALAIFSGTPSLAADSGEYAWKAKEVREQCRGLEGLAEVAQVDQSFPVWGQNFDDFGNRISAYYAECIKVQNNAGQANTQAAGTALQKDVIASYKTYSKTAAILKKNADTLTSLLSRQPKGGAGYRCAQFTRELSEKLKAVEAKVARYVSDCQAPTKLEAWERSILSDRWYLKLKGL